MAGNAIYIRGLDQLIAKMQNPRHVSVPARRFLQRATMVGEASAKKAAPVDTGHLRRSITHRVDGYTVGRFGTNTPYGPHVEYGTKAHWPPVEALGGWAKRKGIPPGAVAAAIAKRGTRAQPYMRPAVKDVEAAIPALSAMFMRDIEASMGI
mgnify:CR=1 FL=1